MVTGVDRKCTLVRTCCVRIASHPSVSGGCVSESGSVARIQLQSSLEILQRFGPATLTPVDESRVMIDGRIIGQDAPGQIQLDASTIIISEVQTKVTGLNQMNFSGIRLKTNCF